MSMVIYEFYFKGTESEDKTHFGRTLRFKLPITVSIETIPECLVPFSFHLRLVSLLYIKYIAQQMNHPSKGLYFEKETLRNMKSLECFLYYRRKV